ncbi:MAG TPA: YggS family pyridoxal phosphate-dependent enzyme [Candidatus Aphodovivens avicola]|nr:YggS family pyridoxal phosphate-dependent enzyme [Candidatus Aphodovivens avicola]
MSIATRYEYVKRQVADAASACGRDPREVRLIAVSKTVGAEGVGEAVAAGAHDFGENRPDHLLEVASVHPGETWHFIGNIQSRRIDDIVSAASMVHSLCQDHHIDRFEKAAAVRGKVLDVLVEVNVSGEESKSGCAPDKAAALVAHLRSCAHLRPRGFMTMAPQGDLAAARACFEGLARLRDEIRRDLPSAAAACFDELSMGMSEDWREAVAAGATMVRIGRAVFDDAFEPPARSR